MNILIPDSICEDYYAADSRFRQLAEPIQLAIQEENLNAIAIAVLAIQIYPERVPFDTRKKVIELIGEGDPQIRRRVETIIQQTLNSFNGMGDPSSENIQSLLAASLVNAPAILEDLIVDAERGKHIEVNFSTLTTPFPLSSLDSEKLDTITDNLTQSYMLQMLLGQKGYANAQPFKFAIMQIAPHRTSPYFNPGEESFIIKVDKMKVGLKVTFDYAISITDQVNSNRNSDTNRTAGFLCSRYSYTIKDRIEGPFVEIPVHFFPKIPSIEVE